MNKRVRRRLFGDADTKPCAYCGRVLTLAESTLDHVKPRSRNGRTDERNCVVACRECNWKKGNGWAKAFRSRAKRKPVERDGNDYNALPGASDESL